VATRKQKVKVGVFLGVCIGLMVAATMVITGLYKEPGNPYWLEFEESILGLYEGGLVVYLGVPVGKVKEILVTENRRAHVEVLIDPHKVTLHNGVQGQLVLYSLAAGTMAIGLEGGSPADGDLPPNGQIPAKMSTFGAVSSQITEVMDQVSGIAEKVNTELAQLDDKDIKEIVDRAKSIMEKGEGLADKGSEFLTETTETIKKVKGNVDQVMNTLEGRSRDLEKLAVDMDRLVSTATEKLKQFDMPKTQENLNEALKNVASLAEEMDKTVSKLGTVAADVSHETDNVEYSLRAAMTDLRRTFESLRVLLEQLQGDPSQLVRGKAKIKAQP
jgi:ABC-type transporter Mla subunit MlaD